MIDYNWNPFITYPSNIQYTNNYLSTMSMKLYGFLNQEIKFKMLDYSGFLYGTLKEVAYDYFEVDNDGEIIIYNMSNLISFSKK